MNLDDLDFLKRNDPQDMGGRIAELPLQCRQAWELVKGHRFPAEYRQAEHMVILGMGGSAIGGDLLRTLMEDRCPAPIFVVRDYHLPRWVGKDSLVIASSHSGNTEETLAAFQEAAERGAKLIAVTTDGQLAERAQGKPLLTFSYPSQPRGAIGFSFTLLLGIVAGLGFIPDPGPELEEAIGRVEELGTTLREETPTSHNPAKRLALRLVGNMPVVYGAQHLSEVARRWKGQFNENSKSFASFEVLPELNHNAVEGYRYPPDLKDKIMVVILTSALYHPKNRSRVQVTREVLARHEIPSEVVEAGGETPLAQTLWAVHLGDYVSLYLAALHQVDPSSGEVIAYLKERLAQG